MTEWQAETNATATVHRTAEGNVRNIIVRAEYFEYKEKENGEDEFSAGVNAKCKFDVTDGEIATLVGIKDVECDCPSGYDFAPHFVRTIPAAEKAAWNVPGIEDVTSTQEEIVEELDRGRATIQ